MKKVYIYLTFIVMAVLAVACSKNGSQVDPIKPEAAKEANIGFGSASAHRVGEMVPDPNEKLRIQVYDYYKATSEATEIEYIDELLQKAKEPTSEEGSTSEEDAWVYVKEGKSHSYPWKKGTHKFFGWVTKNAAGQDVNGLSFNKDTKVLTLSESNTDYQYSTLQTVEWPDATLTDGSVPMTVKHLTAALKLKVTNMMKSQQTVAVTSVTLKNVVTSNSATVDYSETAEDAAGKAVVTYGKGTTGNLSLPAIASTTLAAAGSVVSDMTYVWPQKVNPVPAETEPGEEGSEEGGEEEGSEETPAVVATVDVAYTLGGKEKTTTMTLPAAKWVAGNCYTLDLQIVNKGIELTFTVAPWEQVPMNLDTENDSINMSNVTWMNTKLFVGGKLVNTLVNSAYSVYMYKDGYLPLVDAQGNPIVETYEKNTPEYYTEDVYDTYPETVYKIAEEDIYDTYTEDVIDPDTEEVIHTAGEIKTYEETIIDPDTGNPIQEKGKPIILYKKGDRILDENGKPIILHEKGEIKKYEADVVDPKTGNIIHHQGDDIILHHVNDPVLDEYGDPIVHHEGEIKYGPDGEPIYRVGEQKEGYCPAQGFFTVNYPKSGLFKIELIPAYNEKTVEPKFYEIWIYEYPTETEDGHFRPIDPAGEPITNNTVYFQVRAAADQDGKEHKAQINIWFKSAQYDAETDKWIPEDAEWISAYSEIRANYALVIPATS